jgi:hypothetical protein
VQLRANARLSERSLKGCFNSPSLIHCETNTPMCITPHISYILYMSIAYIIYHISYVIYHVHRMCIACASPVHVHRIYLVSYIMCIAPQISYISYTERRSRSYLPPVSQKETRQHRGRVFGASAKRANTSTGTSLMTTAASVRNTRRLRFTRPGR